jgi:serine/threonine protein kinase/ankyrin repeat protein
MKTFCERAKVISTCLSRYSQDQSIKYVTRNMDSKPTAKNSAFAYGDLAQLTSNNDSSGIVSVQILNGKNRGANVESLDIGDICYVDVVDLIAQVALCLNGMKFLLNNFNDPPQPETESDHVADESPLDAVEASINCLEKVIEETNHVLLGEGADIFAREQGFPYVETEELISPNARDVLAENQSYYNGSDQRILLKSVTSLAMVVETTGCEQDLMSMRDWNVEGLIELSDKARVICEFCSKYNIFHAIKNSEWALVESVASVAANIRNSDLAYPLHAAVAKSAPLKTIMSLISYFPNATSCMDKDLKVPLHYAIESDCSIEVIKSLLRDIPPMPNILYVHEKKTEKRRHSLGNWFGRKTSNTNPIIWYPARLIRALPDGSMEVEYSDANPPDIGSIIDQNDIKYDTTYFRVLDAHGLSLTSSLFEKVHFDYDLTEDILIEIIGDSQNVLFPDDKTLEVYQLANRDRQGWVVVKDRTRTYLKEEIVPKYVHPIYAAFEHTAPFEVISSILSTCPDSARALYEGSFPLHKALLSPKTEELIILIKTLAESYPDACSIRYPNGNFPIHEIIRNNLPEAMSIIIENGGSISSLNSENKTPFACFLSCKQKEDFIFRCKDYLSEKALSANAYALWKEVIAIAPREVTNIGSILENLIQRFPELIYKEFEDGHSTLSLANPMNKEAIKATNLWFKNYKLVEPQPIHTSATCFVYKAISRRSKKPVRGGDSGDEYVALKLMGNKAQFLRECNARANEFHDHFVVNYTALYPEKEEDIDAKEDVEEFDSWGRSGEPLTKQQAEQCFCLVMPLASRNLFVSLKQDNFFASKDNLDYVRNVFSKIVECVEHLHIKGVLHGDLKPLNIVKMNDNRYDWRIIDLDASCRIDIDDIGFKSSSAYMPPEAIFNRTVLDGDSHPTYVPKTPYLDDNYSLTEVEREQLFLLAHPSYDIWSLGCILYQLCHPDVKPLFSATRDDNLSPNPEDDDSLRTLYDWTDSTKNTKMIQIKNKFARNLIMQMLSKDPSKRPSLQSIRNHPFMSNKLKTARLYGEPATVS